MPPLLTKKGAQHAETPKTQPATIKEKLQTGSTRQDAEHTATAPSGRVQGVALALLPPDEGMEIANAWGRDHLLKATRLHRSTNSHLGLRPMHRLSDGIHTAVGSPMPPRIKNA